MFDVMVHVLGGQRLPILLGIKQYDCEHHIFVETQKEKIGTLRPFLDGKKTENIVVDEYDPNSIYEKLKLIINEKYSGKKVGFNLTGGTKVMYAGAFAACNSVGGTPFYIASDKDKVISLQSPFNREKLVRIEDVVTFLQVNSSGLDVSNDGFFSKEMDERRDLTKLLWKYRNQLGSKYRHMPAENNKWLGTQIKTGRVNISVDRSMGLTVSFPEETFVFDDFPDIAEYFRGKWLEEFTYAILEPFKDSGLITDLRIGLKLKMSGDEEYQDFDISFTDGRTLYIVECKAGALKSDHVEKLESLVQKYGGVMSKGFFAAAFAPSSKATKKKIKDSRALEIMYGSYFDHNISAYMETNLKP